MYVIKKRSFPVQQDDVRKEDAMNAIIVLNKIKEYAEELLKIYMLVDNSKRKLLNKFYSRSKSKNKYSSKRNSALSSIQTQNTRKDAVVQCSASFANSKDIKVLYCAGPSTSKIRDCSLSENSITCVKTITEKLFVKDKDITARIENHDIGLNVSLPRTSLREMGTQYIPKQLEDSGTVTDCCFEEKISIATQSCEPILIRVIKSNNNNEGILKSDKGTCVRDAHVLWMANVDRGIKHMYQKDSVRKYYDESHPGVSHVREKEVNCADYRSSSFVPNGIYKYKRYKSSLPCNYDWTKTNIPNFGLPSNQRISKIPLYAKSRKCTRRTELYRMS